MTQSTSVMIVNFVNTEIHENKIALSSTAFDDGLSRAPPGAAKEGASAGVTISSISRAPRSSPATAGRRVIAGEAGGPETAEHHDHGEQTEKARPPCARCQGNRREGKPRPIAEQAVPRDS